MRIPAWRDIHARVGWVGDMGIAAHARVACPLLLLLALAAPERARAYESCGTGGVTGDQVMVELEGSLYYVTTPAGYDESQPWPLILGLHGDEGDPALSVNWNWRRVADDRFIFVAPKATNEGGSWYMATEENTAWMDRLVESLLAQYNVDLDRVYMWGLSGGAQFTSGYALSRQDLFAGVQFNMGGSIWQYRRAGMEGTGECKIPARFVVSTTDFLRDGALELFDALTADGHETEWLDAACEGHCWDDVESGTAARDWLLAHTYCGTLRGRGCEGGPLEPPPDDAAPPDPDPTGAPPDAGTGMQPPAMQPEPDPAGVAGMTAPQAPGPAPAVPTPGPAPTMPLPTPTAGTEAPPIATPVTAPTPPNDASADAGGCRVTPRGSPGTALPLPLAVALLWLRRHRALRRRLISR